MNHSNIQELETKISFIERHIEEQDRVILKLLQTIDTLEERIGKLEDNDEQSGGGQSNQAMGHERPPHY